MVHDGIARPHSLKEEEEEEEKKNGREISSKVKISGKFQKLGFQNWSGTCHDSVCFLAEDHAGLF